MTRPPMTFVNPSVFDLPERLDDVMILLPSYKTPHPLTRGCLDELVRLGADVQHSWGCSDPALHRCLMAGRAWDGLRQDNGKYKFVLWFDDDMVCKPGTVQLMRHCAKVLNVSISGLYCKRGMSTGFALSREQGECLRMQLPVRAGLLSQPVCDIELPPVIGGLGCLLIPREQFLLHVQSVPNVTRLPKDTRRTDVPGVCSSGYCADGDGRLGWLSEDLVYGQSLWHWCRGVYACPVAWAHVSEVPLLPLTNAVWLNEGDSDEVETISDR